MVQRLNTKVALIGGGPACASAAIQLIRSGIDILLISEAIGGTIKNANLIENLIGFPEGITGEEYVKLLTEQLKTNSVPIVQDKVLKLERSPSSSYLITTSKTEVQADIVIVGTGTIPKKLEIEGEELAFKKKKLFYEIWRLKPYSNDKDIIIIGSGDVAYDYALNLHRKAKSIKILQRSAKTKSLHILQERVSKKSNIILLKSKIPIKIQVERNLVTLMTKSEDQPGNIKSDFILVAIGRKPNIDYLSPSLLIEYAEPQQEPTVFFIGDVKNGNYRQVSIAMGDGVKAAMETLKRIKEKGQIDETSRQIW
ncbi:MAG: NAD(P)/FAD-dependent oxidoreductase [Candidatus Hodarchaeota archaeon]